MLRPRVHTGWGRNMMCVFMVHSLIFQDKEIYLLDDPLAAVDADVAHHLMEKCILGILKNKTRILCTHRIEFVDKADVVVLMDNGMIVKTGTCFHKACSLGSLNRNFVSLLMH